MAAIAFFGALRWLALMRSSTSCCVSFDVKRLSFLRLGLSGMVLMAFECVVCDGRCFVEFHGSALLFDCDVYFALQCIALHIG